MTKKEQFIQTIKQQFNIELKNDKDDMFNQKRNVLYTNIEKQSERVLLNYLIKNDYTYNEHLNGYYWINL